MRSKVNFGHPKWPTAAILFEISIQNKGAYRSEVASNAIESEFRTSKMADGSHLVKNFKKQLKLGIDLKWQGIFPKKIKLRIDLKWPEMRSKVNFGHPKCTKNSKNKKYGIDLKW